jgi:signal transduction histidine kinase
VQRLREELRSTQDRLTALGLMVSSVSHGVKGILTGLDGGVYLAESGLRKAKLPQVEEGVSTVRQMVERLRRVVLDVLYFAKERPLAWKSMDVREFSERLLELAGPRIQQQPIELISEWGNALGVFEVDEAVLTAALFNILENAVDACAEDRSRASHRINLRVDGGADQVIFDIADDGIGMAPEIREHIFDLFYSSKGQAGTGLGLFITRQVIQQHGGRIEVESTPGQGTRFRVRLPRLLPHAEKERTPEVAPA